MRRYNRSKRINPSYYVRDRMYTKEYVDDPRQKEPDYDLFGREQPKKKVMVYEKAKQKKDMIDPIGGDPEYYDKIKW